MRRPGVLLLTVLVAGVWLVDPAPAESGELSISLGMGFVVGGASFHVAYATGGYFPYYYRFDAPLYYRGYDCSAHCYVGGRHFYHAPFCPIVTYHFSRYRFDGPHYRRSRGYGYGHDRHRRDHRRSQAYRHNRGHGRYHYDASSRYRGHSRHQSGSRSRGEIHGHRSGKSDRRLGDRSHEYRDGHRRHREERSRVPGAARRSRPGRH